MTERNKPSSSEGADRQAAGSGRRDPDRQEPDIEGPQGPLDDQPQREDEYLSNMLKEFNPQRKDETTPLRSSRSGKELEAEPDPDDLTEQPEPRQP